jgi:xanthine dehydrogenase YagS FAD-binding subunit
LREEQGNKVKAFEYQRATDVAGAVASHAGRDDVRYLGGGTNLVDLMKLGVENPSVLIDVSGLPLDEITVSPHGAVVIGAAVRNSDLAAHPAICNGYPAVAQAVLAGASGQLRNMATVGGNLMQRTRCSYFCDTSKPCNKREPGSGCPARAGDHHNLAILGGSEQCIATSPSDLAVALTAFDAVVHLATGTGERRIGLAEFRRLPGTHPEIETNVADGALVVAVELPPAALAASSRYRKVRERASYAFAIGSIAAALDVRDGVIAESRIAWGAVAPVPWRAKLAEQALLGAPATPASFEAAAAAELERAEPLPGNSYKMDLIRNLTVEVLTELSGGQR